MPRMSYQQVEEKGVKTGRKKKNVELGLKENDEQNKEDDGKRRKK